MKFPLSLFVLLVAQSSFGVIYYVTPTGSAANSGLSLSSPKNQAWAQSGANSGDTVLFYPGNYTNLLLARSGVGIVAPYKWQAIVWGSNGLHGVSGNDGVANVMVDGLQIAYSYKDGAKANGSGWTMRNLWVHHAGRGDPLWVTNSTFAFSGQGIAWHGYSDILVERCLLEYNGADIGHDHGLYASGTNCIVRDNVARDNLAYGYQIFGSNPSSSANFWLINNIGYSNDTGFAQGKRCAVMYGDNGWGTNYAIGNTFSSPAASSGHALVFGGLAGCFLYVTNNILSSAPSGIANDGAGTIVSDYNMYLASPTPSEGHATVASPIGFVSPSTGLYWLTVSSQARAHAFSAASPTNNFFGDPISSVSDIGAVDYTAILAADTRTLDPSPAGGADYWSIPTTPSNTYYVDPDYAGGSSDGSYVHPWTSISSGFTAINASLASGDVTVYFSALKANGTSQQSSTASVAFQRKVTGGRLTYDGHSFYNVNTTTPNWAVNTNPIITAYTNHQVYKVSTAAMGWGRTDGQNTVSDGGLFYTCIKTHVAAASNEPGVGANWTQYWDQHGSSGAAWVSGTTYWTLTKQDSVTMHGFDVTGIPSYVSCAGDNLVGEYLFIHDQSDSGNNFPCLTLLYTSYPDSSGAQIIAAPSTNILFNYIKAGHSQAEVIYLGSINPDATAAFQVAHGNQHDLVTVTNFEIYDGGIGGGQGDGIDCKNGITRLTITHGTMTNMSPMGAIILPQTFTPGTDQQCLIDSVKISHVYNSGDNQQAIYGFSSTVAGGLKGYNGVTIRNSTINDVAHAINFGASGICSNIYLFNNTVRGCTNDFGLALATTSGGTSYVSNNVVMFCNANGNQNSFSGGTFAVGFNAYSGTWSGGNLGGVSGVTDSDFISAANNNFALASLGVREVDAGIALSGFSTDFLGTSRPQGSAWDIGAYELRQSIARSASNLHVKNGYSGHP